MAEEKKELLKAVGSDFNMENYEEAYANFDWADVEQEFTWYETGKVNYVYEAIDRHVEEGRGDRMALIYSDGDREVKWTYADLKAKSNKFANILRDKGVKKGDRIFIFMNRSPELYTAFLGAIKIGAIVGPLFEAFMENAVRDRLEDSDAVALITTSALIDRVPYGELAALKHIIITDLDKEKNQSDEATNFYDFAEEMAAASDEAEVEWLSREDGILLHYTSGSTGKPKGILHVHNIMVQHWQTAKWVLDFKEGDVYWCTADPGWVTGTAYGIFSPWLHGVTNVVRGGRFSAEDWYDTLAKYGVTVWYSAPTAYRLLMSKGEELVKDYDLSKLRHILSVGEPLNPEVIRWGMKTFNKRIHDTWWMTETGGHMIVNFRSMDIRPGSMGKPFPGIVATIVDDSGKELPPYQMGNLAIKSGWPAMMRKVWNNQAKYDEYFVHEPWYISGDSAYMDEDGYFFFQGRVDDVINTSGERVGPFEVESKLLEHPAVAEAGVIGKPDPLRGEIIKAFVSLNDGYEPTEELKKEIRDFVKLGLAAHAAPREIEFKDGLPKTRSGKIMRRVLKAWELNLPTGDLSTMEK